MKKPDGQKLNVQSGIATSRYMGFFQEDNTITCSLKVRNFDRLVKRDKTCLTQFSTKIRMLKLLLLQRNL